MKIGLFYKLYNNRDYGMGVFPDPIIRLKSFNSRAGNGHSLILMVIFLKFTSFHSEIVFS